MDVTIIGINFSHTTYACIGDALFKAPTCHKMKREIILLLTKKHCTKTLNKVSMYFKLDLPLTGIHVPIRG